MVDISDSKFKQMLGKSWSAWNLQCSTTEFDTKVRDTYKPKEPSRALGVNKLPNSLLPLYGTRPDVEYFSVSRCPGCKFVMKSQWLSRHYKRDAFYNLVCRRTDMVVAGGKCLGKSSSILYDIKESSKNPLADFETTLTMSSNNSSSSTSNSTKKSKSPIHEPVVTRHSPTRSSKSSSSSSHSHKTESSSSKSKSSSHSKKSSSSSSISSSSSSRDRERESSSRHKSSKSSSSWGSSSSSSKRDSKSQKSISSTASYVLSIPSDDSGQNDSVESILKSSMHSSITMFGSKKHTEPEYEQLKFYADASDKRSKAATFETEFLKSKLNFAQSDGTTFKIPLKSKSGSSSTLSSSSHSHSHSDSKKSKHSSSHHSSSSSKSSSSSSSHDNKVVFRSSSSNSISSSSSKISGSGSHSSSDSKEKSSSSFGAISEVKEKSSSHSKKKKKKKDKDEPRKVIPLKERAFHPDQHCGVVVNDNAQPCTRSLTCKTHSIALRRAVPGRSNPFDSLLAAHKKARDDERFSKVKEVVIEPEVKSKSKKSSHARPLTPTPELPSYSPEVKQISSTKPAISTHKISHTTINHASSAPMILIPPPPILHTQSNSVKSVPASANNVVAKTNIQPTSLPPRQQTKTVSAKPINRPVRVVENKTETPGISLFDLKRDPENNHFYIDNKTIPPGNGVTIKLTVKAVVNDTKLRRRNINALCEWNSVDRIIKDNRWFLKRKGCTDPLIQLAPKRSITSNGVPITEYAFTPAGRKQVSTSSVNSGSRTGIHDIWPIHTHGSSVESIESESSTFPPYPPGTIKSGDVIKIPGKPRLRFCTLKNFILNHFRDYSIDQTEFECDITKKYLIDIPDESILETANRIMNTHPAKYDEWEDFKADQNQKLIFSEARKFLAVVVYQYAMQTGKLCVGIDKLGVLPIKDLATQIMTAIGITQCGRPMG